MSLNDALVNQLRALARFEHADLSIGDEAADEIIRLRSMVREARTFCRLYLLDEYGDADYCIDRAHHDAVLGLFCWLEIDGNGNARGEKA